MEPGAGLCIWTANRRSFRLLAADSALEARSTRTSADIMEVVWIAAVGGSDAGSGCGWGCSCGCGGGW